MRVCVCVSEWCAVIVCECVCAPAWTCRETNKWNDKRDRRAHQERDATRFELLPLISTRVCTHARTHTHTRVNANASYYDDVCAHRAISSTNTPLHRTEITDDIIKRTQQANRRVDIGLGPLWLWPIGRGRSNSQSERFPVAMYYYIRVLAGIVGTVCMVAGYCCGSFGKFGTITSNWHGSPTIR